MRNGPFHNQSVWLSESPEEAPQRSLSRLVASRSNTKYFTLTRNQSIEDEIIQCCPDPSLRAAPALRNDESSPSGREASRCNKAFIRRSKVCSSAIWIHCRPPRTKGDCGNFSPTQERIQSRMVCINRSVCLGTNGTSRSAELAVNFLAVICRQVVPTSGAEDFRSRRARSGLHAISQREIPTHGAGSDP